MARMKLWNFTALRVIIELVCLNLFILIKYFFLIYSSKLFLFFKFILKDKFYPFLKIYINQTNSPFIGPVAIAASLSLS